MSTETMPAFRWYKRIPWGWLLMVFGLCCVMFALILIMRDDTGNQPSAQYSEQRRSDLITMIRKSIVLPSNEEPIIATIDDPTVYSGQSFFRNAQRGDIVLLYNDSKMAVIYRESSQSVIAVGPISVKPISAP